MSIDDNMKENEGSVKPTGASERKPSAGGIKPPMIGRKPAAGGIKPPMIGKKPATEAPKAETAKPVMDAPKVEVAKPAVEAPKAEPVAPARASVKPVAVPTVESKPIASVSKPVEPVSKPAESVSKPAESVSKPAEPEKPLESVRKNKPVDKLAALKYKETTTARKSYIPEDFDDDDDDDDDDEYVVRDAFTDDDDEAEYDEYIPGGSGPDDDDDDELEYVVQDAFPDEKAKRKTFWRSIASEIAFFAISFLVILTIFFVFPPYVVNGPSMQKTLDNKAFGFGYRFGTPQRGDIVIVNTGDREEGTSGDYFIKRVIGVPGDTIKCVYETYDYDVTLSDGSVVYAGGRVYRVYLNGNMLDEPYVWFGDVNFARECECTLGEDEYFIMGDNRFNSNDSRAFGPVSRSDIQCKMIIFIFGKHNPD